MLSAIVAGAMLASSSGVDVKTVNGRTELSLHGSPFHSTNLRVSHMRTLDLAGGAVIALWNEGGKDLYAISLNGTSVQRVTEAKKTLDFWYQPFDPEVSTPNLPDVLKSPAGSQLFVVQFETQALNPYRKAIEEAGGTIVSYIPNNAYVIRMDSETKAAVEAMNFVRYVGTYDPAYRIDPNVSRHLLTNTLGTARYSMLLTDKSHNNKDLAANLIRSVGGVVHEYEPGGQLIEATLTPEQLVRVAGMDAILWVDLWGPMEKDMDIARIFHGTNNLETLTGGIPAGFSGEGVIGLDRDTELRNTHQEFQAHPPIMLGGTPSSAHGTSTYGIIFASGVNPTARGVLPDAQGVFRAGLSTGATRYNETQAAINNQHVVFETNSTGSPQITTYSSISAEIDTLIFGLNILLCQSQSNTGSQLSRPQAWAKNIVSVGGINHFNTVTPNDDQWGGASIGPASDGRLKPDLASFYDNIYTTVNTSNTSYTTNFGGTSGATPITCGHFGLVFQMWSKGVFNNTAYGTDVFTSKCNAMTAKALMINRAKQWTFPGGHNVQRRQQGWGHAQVDDVYNYRDKGFIVDQTDVLEELDVKQYRFYVPPGETSFNATMVYRDLAGNPAVQAQHRVNDLTLRVVDPGGNVYWGNNGLSAGMTSTSGGVANTKDTVENVLLLNPVSGVWTVEVSAPELNGDTHPETPAVDADYALVVTGVSGAMALPTDSESLEVGNPNGGSLADTHLSDNAQFIVRPGVVLSTSQAPVRIIKEVVAPTTPGSLWIVSESSANSNSVDEIVQAWNWGANAWVTLATHTDLTNIDKARTVFIPNPANYVNGQNHVRVRMAWRPSAATLVFPWQTRIDHIRVAFAP